METPFPSAAFDLDSSVRHGRVALVFVPSFEASSSGPNVGDELTSMRSVPHKAQVWFQDTSTRWHIMADSFSEYYRLMTAHLGLPRWHYKLMDVGMDRPTTQWFNSSGRSSGDGPGQREAEEAGEKAEKLIIFSPLEANGPTP